MIAYIEKCDNIGSCIKPIEIHGMFPYKRYYEVMGNSGISKYIVIVSMEEICNNINEISIDTGNTVRTKKVKPNISKGKVMIKYKVVEISINDLLNKDIEMEVFRIAE